ncbi:c-type cytochrome [Janthinobacterium aquaticum]|uniref:c-type cytochrome n=1 Tax=Janthinobacterium sp. FT58W TaxID=2654254 RepID=UPI0012658CE5|nr:c-type cytochrome [Janthinobacterium sp. FT58W]KAB8040121.1 cytochrome c5 family protein [Janthinobacterium sp. FT58W]
MSDAHNEQQSAIKTPKQLAMAVIGFFLVTVIGIILLVQFVTTQKLTGAGSDSQTDDAIAARLSPVADQGFTFKDASGPKVLQSGEAIYTSTCVACHGASVAGAPKFGDAGAWSARLAQGYETVVKHAIEGLRAMPAKGGNPDLDDVEVARAVVYIANASGGKFKEPEAPAAAAPADGAAPAAEAASAPAAAPAK